jgi:hypothetical protein
MASIRSCARVSACPARSASPSNQLSTSQPSSSDTSRPQQHEPPRHHHGQLSKARRGQLQTPLPVGLVYDGAGHVVLDPDTGVRDAIAHVFDLFVRTGSARAVVARFNAAGLLFPVRVRTGAHTRELARMPLRHWRVLRNLYNPRYAGAFVYGRRHECLGANGKKTFEIRGREEWITLIPNAHSGYLSWQ